MSIVFLFCTNKGLMWVYYSSTIAQGKGVRGMNKKDTDTKSCSSCVWGQKQENVIFCPFIRCVKEKWDE
jgi:hypothetical protein